MDTGRGDRVGGMNTEGIMETYAPPNVRWTPAGIRRMTQGTHSGAATPSRGGCGWEEAPEGGMHVHLWGFMSVCALSLSVVPTLRKTDQYCKAIILPLKIN